MLMHPDIGLLNDGSCYVFLEGSGLHREPMYGSYEDCLTAIDERGGVDSPIPTDRSYTMADYKAALAASKPTPVPQVPTGTALAQRSIVGVREYTLSFRTSDEAWRGVHGFEDAEENVFAKDRNDALRKGREILREVNGRFGPKIKINARLADREVGTL